jgi:uncharacterized membrane protein YdjX (TVP38/TMEM64 family)
MSQIRYKGVLLAILVLFGIGIKWLCPEFFPRLFALSIMGDVHGAVEYLRSFGAKAALISFFLLVIINLLGFLPNIFLLVANGFLFGLVPGILISWAGECVGAAAGFFTMRRLFQDSAAALLEKSGYEEKVEDFSSHNGFGLILAGRSLPFMPSGVLTAAGALSSVSFRAFILATCIGKTLSVTIEILAGLDMVNFHEHASQLIGLTTLSLLMGWGYLRYVKRCKSCK